MIKIYLPDTPPVQALAKAWSAALPPQTELTSDPEAAQLRVAWQPDLRRLVLQSPWSPQALGHFSSDPTGLDALGRALQGAWRWSRLWTWSEAERSPGLLLSLWPREAALPFTDTWTAELWQPAQALPFTAIAHNAGAEPLCPTLLYLGANGQVAVAQQDPEPLAPGETRDLLEGSAYLSAEAPPEQWERLVLLGSPAPRDMSAWTQTRWEDAPEELPHLPTVASADRLAIHLLRPQATVGPEAQSLGQGKVRVQGHPSLRLSLSLSHSGPNTRSLGGDQSLAQLQGVELLPLAPRTRSMGHPLPDTLEISGIDARARAAVRQQPLQLELHEPLDEDSALVPMAFDGEFLLPVGRSTRTEAGTVAVEIDHLPEEGVRSRSIGQALKLYFLKAVKGTPTLQLRRVVYGPHDTLEQTEEGLAEAVAQAECILLVVHGIIGNTKEMARSVRFAQEEGAYDLVLSLDYENLATPVSETALRLKAQLQTLGATEKTLDIMAHSMGGLVSRWLIEREGGHRFVRRLLMLGTPNGGSAFSMLAPIIPALLAMAANLKSPVLGGLVYALQWINDRKRINTTLGDMDKDSNLLLQLNTTDPVATQYAILAGDVRQYRSQAEGWFSRLIDKAMAAVGNLVYREEANDIAVSVPAILRLPVGKEAYHRVLPTHHLIYFSHEPSLQVIRELLLKPAWEEDNANPLAAS